MPTENQPLPAFGLCPACDSTSARLLYTTTDRLYRTTDRTFQVVECRQCRLLRIHPWPSPAELGRYYPDNYWFSPDEDTASRLAEKYRRFVLRDHVRFVRRAMERAGGDGLVLDVGCGGGLFLRLLSELGYKVAGLDFSCGAAAVAWRRNRVPAVCGSLAQAPFRDGCCSVLTMFHVLEHLYEPGSYLEAARRLLSDQGRLVVQVPNAACWQFFLLGDHWSGLDVPRHLFSFREADLKMLLEQCGFEIVRTKHFSMRDNPAGFATSLAPWLDPMVRRLRKTPESGRTRLAKNLLYFALVVACFPPALMEAACHAGSTVMIEARKKTP